MVLSVKNVTSNDMNREIKFRAFDLLKKEMFFQGSEYGENRSVFWKKWENTKCTHPEQFTGLLDCNGKEIYEGDIVRILYTDWTSQTDYSIPLEEYLISISHIGVVAYEPCEFGILFGGNDYISRIHCGQFGRIEVIGNIHENHELL